MSTPPSFDLISETSFCTDESAFFIGVISEGPPAPVGGKSRTAVLSTSSIGISKSIGTPLMSPSSWITIDPVLVGINFEK